MTEPYRTDTDATADRLLQLEEELRSLDRAAARREQLQREVEELRAHLASARARGPLEDLRIASPCNQRWERMLGDDRVRHCSSCDKDVYNVAGMTRAEALQLITNQTSEGLCLRLFRREDGTVITADCPVGLKKQRVRRLVMAGAGVAASVAGAAGALWFWADGPQARMGDIHPSPSASAGQRRPEPALMGTAAPVVPTTQPEVRMGKAMSVDSATWPANDSPARETIRKQRSTPSNQTTPRPGLPVR
jgi:hypothetical protein